MDVQELRIGNWVNIIGLIPTEITVSHLVLIEEGDEGYKPIPLTEEWLVKFGFEKNKESRLFYYHPTNMFFDLLNSTALGEGYFKFKAIDLDHKRLISNELKSVHQLQNLYHAMTGEELEIKKLL